MINRRIFLVHSAVLLTSGTWAQTLPLLYAPVFKPLHDPYQSIALVQEDLFPPSAGVPTLQQLNSIGFLKGVMHDARITQREKNFLLKGVRWLHEESMEMYEKKYYQLTLVQRQRVLQSISRYGWGENWIYTILGYIFESMFSDPIYGANSGGIGWKWLGHESGYPRPRQVRV